MTYDQKVAAGDVQEDDAPPRQAFCILQLSNLAGVVEVVVGLQGREKGASAEQVVQWKEVRAVDRGRGRGPWGEGGAVEGSRRGMNAKVEGWGWGGQRRGSGECEAWCLDGSLPCGSPPL